MAVITTKVVATVVALLFSTDGNVYQTATLVWDAPTKAELKECAFEADDMTKSFNAVKGTIADKGYRYAYCQITTE